MYILYCANKTIFFNMYERLIQYLGEDYAIISWKWFIVL
jgi:hypothetical protein